MILSSSTKEVYQFSSNQQIAYDHSTAVGTGKIIIMYKYMCCKNLYENKINGRILYMCILYLHVSIEFKIFVQLFFWHVGRTHPLLPEFGELVTSGHMTLLACWAEDEDGRPLCPPGINNRER